VCKGEKFIDGHECRACSGTGKKLTKDVSDVMGLPFPQSSADILIAPNVAGFVQPELETLVAINNELLIKYKEIEFGIWGSNYERATNETATGKWIDSQPVFDALQHFSNWAENTEKRLTDFIGGILYKGAYKTCSIVYGKRYMIEPADIIFTKYLDAKGKGAPKATLDNYLIQYYHTLYETDSSMLNKMIIRLKCEPFTHNTVDEVKGWNVDEIDYLKKVYYPEWEKTIPETEWTTDNYEKLDKSLTDYATKKIKVEKQEDKEIEENINQ
jgi:hypothetical protein